MCFVPRDETLAGISVKSRRIFEAVARQNLHLAVAELPVKFWRHLEPEGDRATVTCLRSALMKPEHLEWVDRIVGLLKECAD